LLPGVGSLVVLVTWATLPTAPLVAALACTTMVKVAVVLAASVAAVPVTWLPLLVATKPLPLTLTTVRLAETRSVTVTLAAVLEPALKTVMV
jgi:predicted neutral ceramidase superfamily lipid hydrolase